MVIDYLTLLVSMQAGAASIPNASPFSLDAKPKCFMMEEEKLVSPAKTKCTSTPNMAGMVFMVYTARQGGREERGGSFLNYVSM